MTCYIFTSINLIFIYFCRSAFCLNNRGYSVIHLLNIQQLELQAIVALLPSRPPFDLVLSTECWNGPGYHQSSSSCKGWLKSLSSEVSLDLAVPQTQARHGCSCLGWNAPEERKKKVDSLRFLVCDLNARNWLFSTTGTENCNSMFDLHSWLIECFV